MAGYGYAVGCLVSCQIPKSEWREPHVRPGTVCFLEVGPKTSLFKGYGRVDRDTPSFLSTTTFGRNDNSSVTSHRTIEGCCSRAFQHGYRLNILRIDIAGTITKIYWRILIGISRTTTGRNRARIDGNTIDNEESFTITIV